jgi:uncharacterized membrane protein
MTRVGPMRWVIPLAVVLAAVAGSCTEIGMSPTTITSLEFDSLPYPAVVTGDTLRDSLGRAVPLHAIAFNAAGRIVPNPSITYLALDSGLTIGPTGIVTAQLRNGAVRVIASAPGLQSVPETLTVARRPDTVFATSPVVDTLLYVLPDNAGSNVSPALTLQLATRDTAGGIAGTQGWLVSYQVLFHGNVLAVTDTSVASLWNGASKPALIDTTAAGGTASRTLRVRPAGLPTAVESVTVVATVRYRGAPVPGGPIKYLIQIRKHP